MTDVVGQSDSGQRINFLEPNSPLNSSRTGRGTWRWTGFFFLLATLGIALAPSPARGNDPLPRNDRPELYLPELSENGHLVSTVTGHDVHTHGAHRAISLRCHPPAIASHVESTAWLLENEVLTEHSTQYAGTILQYTSNPVDSVPFSRLDLDGITANASGLYTCYQTCRDSNDHYFLAHGHKFVRVLDVATYIDEHFQERGAQIMLGYAPMTVQEGATVKLECRAETMYNNNEEYAVVRWRHNGRYILPVPGRIATDYRFGILRLISARPSDSGSYQCIAQNKFHGQRMTFNLTVIPVSQTPQLASPDPVVVNGHGPKTLRRGACGTYGCYGPVNITSMYNITWTLPSGYTVRNISSNEIHLTNLDATTYQRAKVQCVLQEISNGRYPLATSLVQVQSLPARLPRPHRIRYKQRRHFLRIIPPKVELSRSAKAQVIGIQINLTTDIWSLNRTLHLPFNEIHSKKIFFSELLYERSELLQTLLENDVRLDIAYLDVFGAGYWYSMRTRVLSAPLLPYYLSATVIPGVDRAVRIQWNYPGNVDTALVAASSNVSMAILSNNLADYRDFNSWTTAVNIRSIDLFGNHSIVLQELPQGLYRFKARYSVAKSVVFPVHVRNITAFGQHDGRGREGTRSLRFTFRLQGRQPCSAAHSNTTITSNGLSRILDYLNSLCLECLVKTELHNAAMKSPVCPRQTALYRAFDVTISTVIVTFSSRDFCSLMSNIRDTFLRDTRNNQVHVDGIGNLEILDVCGQENICLKQYISSSNPPSLLGHNRPDWRLNVTKQCPQYELGLLERL